MSYDDEEVLDDSGFNLREDDDLDETSFDEPLDEHEDVGFSGDEEPELESI